MLFYVSLCMSFGLISIINLLLLQESIVRNTKSMIEKFGTTNYICNLGHGIYPDTPTQSVQAFIDTVHSIPLE